MTNLRDLNIKNGMYEFELTEKDVKFPEVFRGRVPLKNNGNEFLTFRWEEMQDQNHYKLKGNHPTGSVNIVKGTQLFKGTEYGDPFFEFTDNYWKIKIFLPI